MMVLTELWIPILKILGKKIEDDPKNPIYIITVYGAGYKFGGI